MDNLSNIQKLALEVDYVIYAHDENIANVALAYIKQLKRDRWAVRVLDACEDNGCQISWVEGGKVKALLFTYPSGVGKAFEGFTRDAARHAAALAVWPKLSAEEQARIGECP